MIIRIRIKNFLSFYNEVELSMIPGQSRKKAEHKSSLIGGYSVLKTTVVYGANAGGKSNLVKAFAFMKYMVLHGYMFLLASLIRKSLKYKADTCRYNFQSHI